MRDWDAQPAMSWGDMAEALAEIKELRRLASNLASALRTGENQARSEALADWDAHA